MTKKLSPAILSGFHELIRSVAGKFVDNAGIEMQKLPENVGEECYFPVPGMYGGIHYSLETHGDEKKLIVTSSTRIVEDSEQTFEITAHQTIQR